jgi:hypothetical protein
LHFGTTHDVLSGPTNNPAHSESSEQSVHAEHVPFWQLPETAPVTQNMASFAGTTTHVESTQVTSRHGLGAAWSTPAQSAWVVHWISGRHWPDTHIPVWPLDTQGAISSTASTTQSPSALQAVCVHGAPMAAFIHVQLALSVHSRHVPARQAPARFPV